MVVVYVLKIEKLKVVTLHVILSFSLRVMVFNKSKVVVYVLKSGIFIFFRYKRDKIYLTLPLFFIYSQY